MLLLTVVFASCSNMYNDMEDMEMLREAKIENAKAMLSKMKFKITVTPINGQRLRNTFKISQNELIAFLANGQMSKQPSSIPYNVEPVIYKGDTIMYLINYKKGWKLYSVDKRMPTILAENYIETGKRAADILQNKAIASWVSDIAGQTNYLAQTDEYDEESESLEQWSTQSRNIKRIPYQPVPGEYIYVGREEVGRTTIYCPHLTSTLWHGADPFNHYCPAITNGSLIHCDAGCTAVSSSQYMYFLQEKLGYSFLMPLYGSCIGSYESGYTQSFVQFTPWNLSNLALTDNSYQYTNEQIDNVALAIGYAGKQIGVNYGLTGSGANYTKVQTYLNSMGVNGSFVDGNHINLPYIIFNMNEPVLTGGTPDSSNTGHMFLIDGGKYDLVEYEDVWRFLEDTTFYDPDRYGVILREKLPAEKHDYAYQCNFGANFSYSPLGSDADDTYYVITNILGYNFNRKYFLRKD